VISPTTRDLQVAKRVPLEAKAQTLYESDRTKVGRLNVRLKAVQLMCSEGLRDDEPERLRHVPLPCVRSEGVISEVRGVESAANDFTDIHDAR
jgi:hypothetical protein